MEVTALGGPHDGITIAIDNGIRSIRFMTLPERSNASMLEGDEPDARVDYDTVTYQVIKWYTGADADGNAGRILMVVLAPDYWPKGGDDGKVYPPWTP
jgi:hypothetical protein